MMKDIKNCIRLLKYGYQVKSNLVAAIIFLMLGVLYAFIGYEQLPFCVIYIFLAVSMVSQVMTTYLYSGFAAASPARKKIEFRYVDILNVILGIPGAIFCLLVAFCMEPAEMEYTSVETLLVIGGLAIILMYVYTSMVFKRMLVGTILFMVSFMVLMMGAGGFLERLLMPVLEGKRALAVVIFLVEFVIGLVLSSVIRRLLYRKSLSKWVAGARIRMEES